MVEAETLTAPPITVNTPCTREIVRVPSGMSTLAMRLEATERPRSVPGRRRRAIFVVMTPTVFIVAEIAGRWLRGPCLGAFHLHGWR